MYVELLKYYLQSFKRLMFIQNYESEKFCDSKKENISVWCNLTRKICSYEMKYTFYANFNSLFAELRVICTLLILTSLKKKNPK